MKKLLFISILFLFMIVYTTAVYATNIEFNCGAIAPANNDVWPSSTISLQLQIDSSKPYDDFMHYGGDDSYVYWYSPDSVALLVDGILNTEWVYDSLALIRYGGEGSYPGTDYPHDEIAIRLRTEDFGVPNRWYLSFAGGFEDGFLGSMPFTPDLQYDLSDTYYAYAGTHYSPPAGHNQSLYITEFSAGSRPVPEPANMLLLGSGLVVLAGFGRKKFKG